ncbi:YqcC family protein [Rheinheimera marina]|uniref:YqcC family protein n=1 Tax=Rheinheimera marina TaxID=1774958 RepID=A0ABV9JRE2_9GAMM
MNSQVILLLDQIEAELKALQLWSPNPPDAAALQSTLPFCYDTMPLQQWLQYVLLPRMRALVEGGLPLPGQISICPIAEEAFKPVDSAKLALINRIGDLDELLSGQRQQQSPRD